MLNEFQYGSVEAPSTLQSLPVRFGKHPWPLALQLNFKAERLQLVNEKWLHPRERPLRAESAVDALVIEDQGLIVPHDSQSVLGIWLGFEQIGAEFEIQVRHRRLNYRPLT